MVWIIGGGGQVRIRVQSMLQTVGSGACSPGNFDFRPFIKCNLGLFPLKTMFPYLNNQANICMTIPVWTASSKKTFSTLSISQTGFDHFYLRKTSFH